MLRVEQPEIHPARLGFPENFSPPVAHVDFQRVKNRRVRRRRQSRLPEAPGDCRCQQTHAPGDGQQPLRPVINGEHRSDAGQQRLGRADIAGRLFAADVLLARLQRQPEGAVARGVLRHADQPARQQTLPRLARGEKRRVRPAVSQRHAKPLRTPQRHVGPELARRTQQRQRQQIRRHRQQRAGGVRLLGERLVIKDRAVRRRVLNQSAENRLVELETPVVPHDHFHTQRQRPRPHHFNRLRMAQLRHKKSAPSGPGVLAEVHRFGGGGRLIQKRGVGHGQPGQIARHRLEIEQRLQAPL